MIYKNQPKDFNKKFEIVSCFVEHDGEILLLYRQDHKPQGNTWGVPAGKVDKGEDILQSMIREIKEETGLVLPSLQLSYFTKLFVKYPDYDFVYHMYHTKLNEKQKVTVKNEEHKEYKWISPQNALNMPLILDLDACIKLFYKL